MAAWIVRVKKHAECERAAIEQDVICIGWDWLEDLRSFSTQDSLDQRLRRQDPHHRLGTVASHRMTLWRFASDMEIGDLVVLRGAGPNVMVGTIVGDYQDAGEHAGNTRHRRRVAWRLRAVPFATLADDLRQSFFSPPTVVRLPQQAKAQLDEARS